MLTVPLAAVPSQTFGIVLDGQNCNMSVYTESTGVYMDLTLAGVVIATARVLRDGARVLQDCQYTAFVGDFIMVDTQGDLDPVYTGLGARWQLVYLEATDLVTYASL